MELRELQEALVGFEEFNEGLIDSDKLWDLSLTIGTNKRVKNIGGTYDCRAKLIIINIHVLKARRGGELSRKLVDNVLRHELAHHIDYINRGKTNHDKHFKNVCKAIGGMVDINASSPYISDIFKD